MIVKILFFVFTISFAISIIDNILGNKLKSADKTLEGFLIMGKALYSMVGILYLSPFIALLILSPTRYISHFFNTDSSIIISSILPIDMGGYFISERLAQNNKTLIIGGVLLSSTMGASIGFTYPVAFGIINKRDLEFFIKGSILGITSIPLSIITTCLIFKFNFFYTVKLLGIVILFSTLITVGLFFELKIIINFMKYLGLTMKYINFIGLIFLAYHILTNHSLIPNNNDLSECLNIPLKMAILIGGSYTFFYYFYRAITKFYGKINANFSSNQYGIEGLMLLLTNCIPTLYLFEKMDNKFKIINASLCMGLASIVGPQLAFLGSVNKSAIVIFMVNKIISAAISLVISILYINYMKEQI